VKKILLAVLLISIFFTGCAENEVQEEQEKLKIKFGVLPIEDTFPLFVAEEEGYFDKYGLNVEIINFQSALERDSALTAKEIDGVITDPLAVILLNNSGYNLKIVSIGLGMTPEEGVFALLASPVSSIQTVHDLEGRKIAVSSNTIIEYVTDVILNENNVTAEKENVKSIPIRMQMLTENKIEAATLPEPLASLAVLKGARVIVADSEMRRSVTQTVIVFNAEFIENNPNAIEKFLSAYGDAVAKINSDPEVYRGLFVEKARIPESLAETYSIPHYPEPQPYPEEFYNDVVDWALSKELIDRRIPYEEVNHD